MRSARDAQGESLSFARSSSPVMTTAAASGAAEIASRPSRPAPGSAPASARRMVAADRPSSPGPPPPAGPPRRRRPARSPRRGRAPAPPDGGQGRPRPSRDAASTAPAGHGPGGGVVPAKLGEIGIRLERLVARQLSDQGLDLTVVELAVVVAVATRNRGAQESRAAGREHHPVANRERGRGGVVDPGLVLHAHHAQPPPGGGAGEQPLHLRRPIGDEHGEDRGPTRLGGWLQPHRELRDRQSVAGHRVPGAQQRGEAAHGDPGPRRGGSRSPSGSTPRGRIRPAGRPSPPARGRSRGRCPGARRGAHRPGKKRSASARASTVLFGPELPQPARARAAIPSAASRPPLRIALDVIRPPAAVGRLPPAPGR